MKFLPQFGWLTLLLALEERRHIAHAPTDYGTARETLMEFLRTLEREHSIPFATHARLRDLDEEEVPAPLRERYRELLWTYRMASHELPADCRGSLFRASLEF